MEVHLSIELSILALTLDYQTYHPMCLVDIGNLERKSMPQLRRLRASLRASSDILFF